MTGHYLISHYFDGRPTMPLLAAAKRVLITGMKSVKLLTTNNEK
jgi:hypothetical protein